MQSIKEILDAHKISYGDYVLRLVVLAGLAERAGKYKSSAFYMKCAHKHSERLHNGQ